MAATMFLAILVLSLIQFMKPVGEKLDGATREHMQQRAEQLNQEMARLLQELEHHRSLVLRSQTQGLFDWEALISAAMQQLHLWMTAGFMVLLFKLCCWLWKRSRQLASSTKERSPRKQVDKEEQEEKPNLALEARSISAKRLLNLSQAFTMVEDLVDELLRICQKHSRRTFMPRLNPVIGVESALAGWGPQEDDAVYHLLLPLKPPRGHAFHLELGPTEEMLAKCSCLRVELQCTCKSERPAKDMLCFRHHPKEKLRRHQGPSLLDTLCTGPYLDIEKTTRWFQDLVKDAWLVLPYSRHCCLTVLPSRRSCKLHLIDASESTVLIHMMFGVLQGDSYTFLSID